jgi:hypothetical protein
LLFSLLSELTRQLALPFPTHRKSGALSYERLFTTFLFDSFFKKFPDRQLLIAIDSVDAAKSDRIDLSSRLFWLLEAIPKNVRIVVTVTCTPGYMGTEEMLEFLNKRLAPEYITTQLCHVAIQRHSSSDINSANNNASQINRPTKVIMKEVDDCNEDMNNESDGNAERNVPLLQRLRRSEQVLSPNRQSDFTTIRHQLRDVVEDCMASVEDIVGYETACVIGRYLCASGGGLSECELLDLLSCNNDILAKVLPSHCTDILRFPPSLLAAFKYYAGMLTRILASVTQLIAENQVILNITVFIILC